MDSESDQCYEAMEEIEDTDSEKWNSVYAVLKYDDEVMNTINFLSSPSTYYYLPDSAFSH